MPTTAEQIPLKVSVIIPTYNRAGYLGEALESVFRQSLAPCEIIVVDDGSTDDTQRVICDAPVRVRYFEQAHQGIAAARNLGLKKATGEAIAWLDSDDLWEPDFLATVVRTLARDGALDGVYTGITMIDAEGIRLRSARRVEPPEMLYDALIRGNFLATPSVVVRKTCYDQVGAFDPRLRIAEDYDMWLRLSRGFRLGGIPCSLVRIRVHADNTMSNPDAQCQARLTLVRKHFGPPQDNDDATPESVRIGYGYAYRAIAILYIECGQSARGWDYLEKAVAQHPPILAQLDTFYELVLGDQPRGYRGDATRLEIAANGTALLHRLDGVFAYADERVRALRRPAYGNAYLALAMLSDQAGEWALARQYILHAIREHPALVCQPRIARRLVKLSSGKRVINAIRRLGMRTNHKMLTESEAP